MIFWKENNKNKSKVDNTHNINQNNNKKALALWQKLFSLSLNKNTEKYTHIQNDPQSALTIWRNTRKIRDCLVDTWKPIQLFIGKLGNFLAKCLCICWKLQKILFIFKKKHTNISTKILKSKTNGTDLNAKMRSKQIRNWTLIYTTKLPDFRQNSQRNCYIFKAKIAASKKPNQTGFQKKDIIQKKAKPKKRLLTHWDCYTKRFYILK